MSDTEMKKENENTIEDNLQEIEQHLETEEVAVGEPNVEALAEDPEDEVVVEVPELEETVEEEPTVDVPAEETAEEESKAEETVAEELATEEGDTESQEGAEEKPKKKYIGWIIGGCILGVILLVYFGMTIFFSSHFQYNTTVNGQDVSWKTVQATSDSLAEQASTYVLTLEERNSLTESIKGTDIELNYKSGTELEDALEKQNPFLWFIPFLEKDGTDIELQVIYNEEKLVESIAALKCLAEDAQELPVSAIPVYNGTQFDIQAETLGTQLVSEQVQTLVTEAVQTLTTVLNLETENCYVMPTFLTTSQEVIDAQEAANTCLNSQITYTVDGDNNALSAADFAEWITFDDKMALGVDKKKATAYVKTLSKKYNTVGTVREITTPTGKKAKVSGGTYGRKVDEAKEYEQLIKDIQSGEHISREPKYSQNTASKDGIDWGTTYLEVDLTEQHMWYIKDGEVVFESDVVTGAPTAARKTPQGVYKILEKKRNKTLRGQIMPNGKPEYLTPVAYWMRVTWTGIGFHDATWQAKFGGQRYKQGYGSHGCINMPLKAVKELYGQVEKGCPVVIHY